jgi:uncharacterized protein involved in response to NO
MVKYWLAIECINPLMTWSFNSDPDLQPPFLSIGFRPFFLAAGIYAVIAMLAWVTWLILHSANAVILEPTINVPAHLWHGHEMLFGFAAAVIAGFMLTAVPGWTGARRVAGAPLLFLFACWIAGRIVMWLSSFLPALLVAGIDMLLLPSLALTIAFALFKRFQARNAIFLLLVMILIVTNALVHAEWLGWMDDVASYAMRIAILNITLMIVVLGGRITPSFTRNAMLRQGITDGHPRHHRLLEVASIAGVAAVLFGTATNAPATVIGTLALFAAIANLARQSLWCPLFTRDDPILWSLHLAYLWIAIGLATIACAELTGALSLSAAQHVLAVGTVGGMTLAMMTRAPLGHTGRALVVRRPIALAYLMMALAAALRGFGLDLMPQLYFEIVLAAGLLWSAGFAIFAAIYLPILIGPSVKA